MILCKTSNFLLWDAQSLRLLSYRDLQPGPAEPSPRLDLINKLRFLVAAVSIREPQLHCLCVCHFFLPLAQVLRPKALKSNHRAFGELSHLISGRSGADNHSCCERMRAVFWSCTEESLAPVLPDLWLLQSFPSSSSVFPRPKRVVCH